MTTSAMVRFGNKGREKKGLETKLLRTDYQKSRLFPQVLHESGPTEPSLRPTCRIPTVVLNLTRKTPLLSSQIEGCTAVVS